MTGIQQTENYRQLVKAKVENKQRVLTQEANERQAVIDHDFELVPVYARAWVSYSVQGAGDGRPWRLHVEFYPGGELNRYNPVELLDEAHEWLDQCFTTIGNAIRVRGLHDCKIEVVAQGQPPVEQDEVWPSNW